MEVRRRTAWSRPPLAIVVPGGLFTAPTLDMVVVPALFLRYGGLKARHLGRAADPPATGRPTPEIERPS